MSDPFVGQIIQGGWSFAPSGYHYCDGALLPVSQNAALFSLLGVAYGGDGRTTFGLPDLRGRGMVGQGTSTSGTSYTMGQKAGVETTTLTLANMPAHTHPATFSSAGSAMQVTSTKATTNIAAPNSVLAKSTDLDSTSRPVIYCPAGTATDVTIAGLNVAGAVTNAVQGSGTPFPTMSPFTVVACVIALQGIYPSRN